MNTTLADRDGSMFGAGTGLTAASEAGCTIAFRTAGVFGGGLTLVTILAGLFGH